MKDNKKNEKVTREEETRSVKIARIVSQLPEREQEKIYYMIKGIEIAGNTQNAPHAAAV